MANQPTRNNRTIRYALLLALEPSGSDRSVADLVSAVGTVAELGARPSKFISDLLRLEIQRGRVARVGWGRYRLVAFPRTTRQRAVAAVNAVAAVSVPSGGFDGVEEFGRFLEGDAGG